MNGGVKPPQPAKVKKSRGKAAFSRTLPPVYPLAHARVFGPIGVMNITRRGLLGLLSGAAAAIGVPSIWAYSMKTYDGPVSDHFDGTRFFDPDGVPPKSLGEVLRWQFGPGRERQAWPEWAPSLHADTPPPRVSGDKLRSSRPRDAVKTGWEILAACDYAARQRCHHAQRRQRDQGGRVRLACARRTWRRHRGDAGADPALVGARIVRSQQGAVGELCAGDAGRQDLHRLRFRLWRGQAFPQRRRGAWSIAAGDPSHRGL